MFMLAAAAAAIAVSSPDIAAARPAGASVRATASVRILSSVTISWGATAKDLPKMRLTRLRDASGAEQPIQLIEFE